MKPVAIREGLIVQPLGEELLIYKQDRDEAHCLNSLTALVWQSSDGTRSVPEIGALVRRELQADADEAIVLSALECLSQAGLMNEELVLPTVGRGVSRRDMLRRVCTNGAFIAASAAVVSMMAPTPAQAQTPPQATPTPPSATPSTPKPPPAPPPPSPPPPPPI